MVTWLTLKASNLAEKASRDKNLYVASQSLSIRGEDSRDKNLYVASQSLSIRGAWGDSFLNATHQRRGHSSSFSKKPDRGA